MRQYPPLEERFWSRVEQISGEDSCWLWMGRCLTLVSGGGSVLAHHLSYQMHIGPIPEGWCVRRRCGNNRCVRPQHLEAFQQQGSNHPRAKLSECEVLLLIRQAKNGVPRVEIAKRYGVSLSTISQVINRKRWLSVRADPPPPKPRKKKRLLRKKNLTEEQVREIRRRREKGVLVVSLAKEFGIEPSSISKIANRRCYKDVE